VYKLIDQHVSQNLNSQKAIEKETQPSIYIKSAIQKHKKGVKEPTNFSTKHGQKNLQY